MTEKPSEEFLVMPIPLELPFQWAAGPYLGRFFRELRDNARLLANKCPQCGRLLFPPRQVCAQCHVKVGEDWVELSDKGVVEDFTVVVEPMSDPSTGERRTLPYPTATIRLEEGVSLIHYLEETDSAKIREGLKVQAVFKPREKRKGEMRDILYFRIVEGP